MRSFVVTVVVPCACCAAVLWTGTSLNADEIRLKNGGVILGQFIDDPAGDATYYLIKLERGGRLKLERTKVAKIQRDSPALREYERRAAEQSLTVEGQWALAEWCREAGLSQQRAVHLEKILQLDPNHAGARRALGYSQINGKWERADEYHQRQGYIRYRGKWRTAQELQVIREREARRNAEREWAKNLVRWRNQLLSEKPYEATAARQHFESINDPFAIDPLTSLIRNESLRPLKILFIRSLAKLPYDRAVNQLIYVSLTDPDIEAFYECIERVAERRNADTVPVYVKALRNANNNYVNRAAFALKKLDDDSAITPLIEALVTQHHVILPGSDATTMTVARPTNTAAEKAMASSPGAFADTGFSYGESAKTNVVSVPNQEVLSALVELSGGVSFGFDQEAWRRWQAVQRQQLPTFATRRD